MLFGADGRLQVRLIAPTHAEFDCSRIARSTTFRIVKADRPRSDDRFLSGMTEVATRPQSVLARRSRTQVGLLWGDFSVALPYHGHLLNLRHRGAFSPFAVVIAAARSRSGTAAAATRRSARRLRDGVVDPVVVPSRRRAGAVPPVRRLGVRAPVLDARAVARRAAARAAADRRLTRRGPRRRARRRRRRAARAAAAARARARRPPSRGRGAASHRFAWGGERERREETRTGGASQRLAPRRAPSARARAAAAGSRLVDRLIHRARPANSTRCPSRRGRTPRRSPRHEPRRASCAARRAARRGVGR